jgi:hypothetical protein
MTKRSILIGLVVLLILAAFIVVRISGHHDRIGSENPASPDSALISSAPKQDLPRPTSSQTVLDKAERTRALLTAGNVAINFWGKVVDEGGVGIPGVLIEYRIIRAGRLDANGTIAEDGLHASISSVADGLFSVSAVSGTTLSILNLTKEGYTPSPSNNLVFGYSGTPSVHTPIKQAPHVFVVRSIKSESDVSSISQQLRLPWDGKAMRIDLDSGSPSPSGNLVLTASRTASTGRFGWSFALAIDGGDLKEAELGTALFAPENGYLPLWQCRYEPDSNPWRFSRDANVYYRINGKFGRLKLQIYADAGPSDVSVHFERFVNSSGGRNTEGNQ